MDLPDRVTLGCGVCRSGGAAVGACGLGDLGSVGISGGAVTGSMCTVDLCVDGGSLSTCMFFSSVGNSCSVGGFTVVLCRKCIRFHLYSLESVLIVYDLP